MDVLIIGGSRIVRKRVLPALATLAAVGTVHVASRRGIEGHEASVPKSGRVFRDYAEALATLPPGLAYVSLPNKMHAEWATKALGKGFHVVVDKPAFTSLAEAEDLLDLARQH